MSIEQDVPQETVLERTLDATGSGVGPGVRAPVVDPRRAVPQPRHDRDGERQPERRAADAGPRLSTPASSSLQWIVDAYSLVFAGLLLTAGSLGDRYGRRLALNGGLVVFGARIAVRGVVELGERGDRRACGDGHRRRVRDAGDVVDPGARVPARRASAGDRDLGRRSPASVSRWAASSAAGCSSTSGGARSSSSTCSSWSSR